MLHFTEEAFGPRIVTIRSESFGTPVERPGSESWHWKPVLFWASQLNGHNLEGGFSVLDQFPGRFVPQLGRFNEMGLN